jgi:dynein heavy chain
LKHIRDGVQSTSPLAFGMHPNAEIGFRTTQSSKLFQTLQELEPRLVSLDGQDDGGTPHLAAESATNEILDRFAEVRLETEAVREACADETGMHVLLVLVWFLVLV